MSENAIAKPQATLADMVGGRQDLLTSLDLSKKASKHTMLAAVQNCDKRLTESIGERIVVTDYLAHTVPVKGRADGEVVECTRLVLIDKDGKTWETVGTTLVKSFLYITFAENDPPWPKGLGLTVRTKKRGERSIYWFDVDK